MKYDDIIIDRGRGPEIKGTRITVYDVLDYLIAGWHYNRIAALFRVTPVEVLAAMKHIRENTAEVIAEYAKMLEREKQGNPPELQARLDASSKRFKELMARIHSLPDEDPQARRIKIRALIQEYRQGNLPGGDDAGPHGGQ
jgi:uncharacterized protein (DUF433 family)